MIKSWIYVFKGIYFLCNLEENLRARKFYEKEGLLMTDD